MNNYKESQKVKEKINERETRREKLGKLYMEFEEVKGKMQSAKGQEFNELFQQLDWLREEIDAIEGSEFDKKMKELRKLMYKMKGCKSKGTENSEIQVEEVEKKEIPKGAEVTIKEYLEGEKVEVKYAKNKGKPFMRRISRTEMLDTRTGEIRKCKQNEYRTQEGIRRAKATLREYIKNYFNGGINQLWYTATYKGEQKSRKELKKHYDSFRRKLKRKYPNVKCIAIPELQDRATWHIHIFMIDITKAKLFIAYEELNKMWGKGNVWVEQMKENDVEKLINYGAKVDGSEKLKAGDNLYWKDQFFKLPKTSKGIQEEVEKDLLENKGYVLNGGDTIEVTNKSTGEQLNVRTIDKYSRR